LTMIVHVFRRLASVRSVMVVLSCSPSPVPRLPLRGRPGPRSRRDAGVNAAAAGSRHPLFRGHLTGRPLSSLIVATTRPSRCGSAPWTSLRSPASLAVPRAAPGNRPAQYRAPQAIFCGSRDTSRSTGTTYVALEPDDGPPSANPKGPAAMHYFKDRPVLPRSTSSISRKQRRPRVARTDVRTDGQLARGRGR